MRIITVSRQFGSGGRELGKRLADVLSFDYYDKEIIEQLAEEKGLNSEYVSSVLNGHEWKNIEISYRHSFNTITPESGISPQLMARQREIIENIAQSGNDCIIVGRDADIILEKYRPFRIYVCADIQSRLDRCMKYENKREESERLTEKQILRNIRKIDKQRAQVREILTGKRWGDSSCFDLTINAGGRDIKKLSAALGEFAIKWFEAND